MADTRVTEDRSGRRGGLLAAPSTRLGWWAGWLAVVFIVAAVLTLSPLTMRLGFRLPGGIVVLVGLAGGALALVALTRYRDRSWFVWLGAVAGLLMFLVAAADFLAAVV